MDPEISKLLTLQEHDARRLEIERQLISIPRDIAALEKQIADVRTRQEQNTSRLKEMEVRRHDMRTMRLTNEDKIAKYKTQQTQVKKNEEYTALTHEIERIEAAIDSEEEQEIALLMEIDTVTEEIKELNNTADGEIEKVQVQINALKARESDAKNTLAQEEKMIEELKPQIAPSYMRAYENVKRRYKRTPFVIPIIDKKIQGLRVTGDVESAARKKSDVVTDEMSGRIVYFPD